MLRLLKDGGDYVYVSSVDDPTLKRRYFVYGPNKNGYDIVSEDGPENRSAIHYDFIKEKWVVPTAEDKFNVRIELNPEVRVSYPVVKDDRIIDKILNEEFEQASDWIYEHDDRYMLNLLSGRLNKSDNIYYLILRRGNYMNILEWLKQNYIIDYGLLVISAIYEYKSDVIAWVLDNKVGSDEIFIDHSMRIDHLDTIWAAIDSIILAGDRIDMFQLISRFGKLFDKIELELEHNIPQSAESHHADKIIQYLREPAKPART